MKYVLLLVTLIGVTSLKSFAGNGDVGSADDGVFSRTTALHEEYNSQQEALKMKDLCKAMESGLIDTGNCQITCKAISENVLSMVVSKKDVPSAQPVNVEFQPGDITLVTFWGIDQEHEYLNSKKIYMRALLSKRTPAGISLLIKNDQNMDLACGTFRGK